MPTTQWNLNQRAMRPANELVAKCVELGCTVHAVSDARVVDAGVDQIGSIEAGLLLARICMSDLGTISIAPPSSEIPSAPQVAVNVCQPVAACMGSQYAGWQLKIGKYFAMGSGPMRAAWGKEDLFDDIGLRENPSCAVGVLEASKLPGGDVVEYLAESCQVPPGSLMLAAARTASLAGGVQVVARSVETALHKLHELHFDLSRVVAGYGHAPLPPVAKNDMAAIGRTNDAMLYGARTVLYVRGDDDSIVEAGKKLPSCTSSDYGQPFAEIFERYDHDFYKIDPMLFSPAVVSLQNVDTGRTHEFGKINRQVLEQSFF